MRLFQCELCGQLLHFESRACQKCGHSLGYEPERNDILVVEREGEGELWRAVGAFEQRFRFCANAAQEACNWLIPEDHDEEYCLACRHNRIIPDLSNAKHRRNWLRIEVAKHRLSYSLLRLNLPLESNEDRTGGLCFDFLADAPDKNAPRIMTGHDEGIVTIALAEADDAEREQRRNNLGELYRTLLGHFRHEAGHYYWNRLVRDGRRLGAFRALFGDETRDYSAALQVYYDAGAPSDWRENFVSAYASAHPWEDFAETFKHYIHIVDTLEMAAAFDMKVRPRLDRTGGLKAEVDFNPYCAHSIQQMVDAWLPISFSLNSLNRCLGNGDAYPFVLGPGVTAKLGFIHGLVHRAIPADLAPVEGPPVRPDLPPGKGKSVEDVPEGSPIAWIAAAAAIAVI